jgi:hypothetical protein
MKRIREWLILGVGFGLAVWVASCGGLTPVWVLGSP